MPGSPPLRQVVSSILSFRKFTEARRGSSLHCLHLVASSRGWPPAPTQEDALSPWPDQSKLSIYRPQWLVPESAWNLSGPGSLSPEISLAPSRGQVLCFRWTVGLEKHKPDPSSPLQEVGRRLIREMQIRTTKRHHLTPIRMPTITNTTNNKHWQGCEEKKTLVHCWWECKLVYPLWKTVWMCLKKLKIGLPYDLAIPLLRIYLNKIKSVSLRGICTFMLIATLFIIAKTWE